MASNPSHNKTHVFIWCWPRSTSTALEKCLSFVDGIKQVWHEPYTVALNGMLMSNPKMTAEDNFFSKILNQFSEMMKTIGQQPTEFSGGKLMPVSLFDYPFVKSKLEEEAAGDQYILIKDMAAAVTDYYDSLPEVPCHHTFLIRHPHRFLSSQRKMFSRMSFPDGDIPDDFNMFTASPLFSKEYFQRDAMHLLWTHVQEKGLDSNPIIIDAEDLINHPEIVLPKYLEALGIPFHKKYLTWDESEESIKTWKGALEQIVLGKQVGVFDRAFKSTCFVPHSKDPPTREELTPDILSIVDYLMPGYDEMYKHRIKPEK